MIAQKFLNPRHVIQMTVIQIPAYMKNGLTGEHALRHVVVGSKTEHEQRPAEEMIVQNLRNPRHVILMTVKEGKGQPKHLKVIRKVINLYMAEIILVSFRLIFLSIE